MSTAAVLAAAMFVGDHTTASTPLAGAAAMVCTQTQASMVSVDDEMTV